MSDRYPTPQYRRSALAPGILGALVLLAGLALIGKDAHTIVLFAASILAAIVGVFAWQARAYPWVVPLGAVVVAFNPIFPFEFDTTVWLALHYGGVFVFIAAALFIRVRNTEDRNKR